MVEGPLETPVRSRDLSYENIKLITSQAEAKAVHRLKKDLDKFTDERTLPGYEKGKLERDVWNLEQKPCAKGQPDLALRVIRSTDMH